MEVSNGVQWSFYYALFGINFCVSKIERNSKTGLYEPLLQESEREAITELLQYLESKYLSL